MLHDLRYAVRMLVKSPGFTVVAVITLALGIGANTAIFSLINAALLRPLPGIPEPNRMVMIGRAYSDNPFDNVSYPNYRDLRDQSTVYTGIAAVDAEPLSVSVEGGAERLSGALVTPNYFRVLEAPIVLGRGFLESEDVGSKASVVVISYGLWVRRFGSDPRAVGRTLTLNGVPASIVGVTGNGFRGTDPTTAQDVWAPLAMVPALKPNGVFQDGEFFGANRNAVWITLIARRKPGVSLEQAAAETRTIYARLKATYGLPKEEEATVLPGLGLDPDTKGAVSEITSLLFAVVGLLLLLACANIANLTWARATVRGRELAVRVALGASRRRIARQLLTESMLLALAAGALGLVVSTWIASGLPKLFPAGEWMDFTGLDVHPDVRVLLAALLISLLTGVLFGLLPAVQSSRAEFLPALKEAGRQISPQSRMRSVLVAAQLTISLVLLIGAGLLLRTLWRLNSVDPGFRVRNLVMMSIDPSLSGHYDPQRLRRFHEQVLERLQALPGVEAASLARTPPLNMGGWGVSVRLPDKQDRKESGVQFNTVATNYFEVMGIPVQQGRTFNVLDSPSAPLVAIVNETAARKMWPGENPVGKLVQLGPDPGPRRIVGVVHDAKYRELLEGPQRYLYCPMSQPYPFPRAATTILLRTELPAGQIAAAVRRQMQSLDPDVPVYRVKTIAQQIGDSVWRQRMMAILLSGFASLALLLGAIGIYGVMAYAVAQRTHEVGIRMALGARPAQVLQMMLTHAGHMILGGIGAGILGALALTRALASLLYGVSVRDAATFGVVTFILALVALLASYLPARRATKVDPMVALRYE